MDWQLYAHLAFTLIAAGIVCAVALRFIPRLTAPCKRQNKAELLVLGLVIALGLSIVYGSFYTGADIFAYRDVGSDTAEQYVPYYLNLLDSIRNGTLGFWNFEYGLGTSFMSYQSWTLDPFNILLIPLGLIFGNSALGGILIAIQSLKVAACGFLFDCLLARFCRIPLSRILGSVIFAFCGYLMLWGQHYWLGSVIVVAVLLTVLLEALMERWTAPRFIGTMLVVALAVMMSTYSGFMVLLYAAVYAALRLAYVSRCHTVGEYMRSFGTLALPVICGLVISLATLIPYATLLLGESSRIAGGEGGGLFSQAISYLTSFVPLDWVPAILSRTMGSSLISSGTDIPADIIPAATSFTSVNVYEFIQLGFSGAVFILLGQFFHWVATEADKRGKVLIAIATALVVLYCFNFFLPALSNVFVDPKYRSSFALAIPICIALAVGWEQRILPGCVARTPLLIAAFLTFTVLIWSFVNTVDGKLICLFYFAAIIAFVVLLIVFGRKPLTNIVLIALCTCILATSFADGFMVTNNRITCSSEDFPEAVEPNHASDTVEALNWIHEQDDGMFRIEKLYTDWTRLDDSLIQGYQGVASYNSTLDSDIEEFYAQLWPGMIASDTAYQEYRGDPNQPELLRMLGVKYLLSHDILSFDWCSPIAKFGDVFVYRVEGTQGIATMSNNTVSEDIANTLSLENRTGLLASSIIVPDNKQKASPFSTLNGTVSLRSDGQDCITGTLQTTEEGTVCLAIPYTKGWTVTIDGQKVETFRANYGFIGFDIASGTHTIEVCFFPENLTFGAAVASIGLIVSVFGCLAYALRKRSRTKPAH